MSRGKKCHICLDRKLLVEPCPCCGHNTCDFTYCMRDGMCLKCRMIPEHRTLKEVRVG